MSVLGRSLWFVGVVALMGVALQLPGVTARSGGILSYCDLTPKTGWPNGYYGTKPNGAAAPDMPWVKAPTASSDYTLRAGDGAASADATQYTPGRPIELHLRVTDLHKMYIGLVLYATNGMANGKEKQVGSWQIPAGEPFQLPATCNLKAVTHFGSDIKPIHTRFFFSAPKGTGTVRFRVLIKYGEQNKGDFYYPAKELSLTEGPSAPTVQPNVASVRVGPAGEACVSVCAKSDTQQYCDAAATKALTTEALLDAQLTGTPGAAWRLPLLGQCAYAGAAQLNADGYASFRHANSAQVCPQSYIDGASTKSLPDVCWTEPLPDVRPICMCTADRSKQPASPAGAVGVMEAELTPEDVELDNEMEAAAPKTTSGPLVAAVIAAGCTIGASRISGRFMLLLLSALLLVSCALPANAHNYIKSQHRAKMASVTVPCPERIGNQPHVQVIKNQDFEIEWSVGHGHNTNVPFYFAIVEEKNLKYLANPNVKTILDQYLKEAPNGALLTGAKWQKNHLFAKKECINDRCKLDNYFLEPTGMPKNDPGYIVREQVYREKATPSIYQDENEVVQVRFKPALLKFDRRAEYANAKWPWLEAVHSFNNTLKEHTFNAVQANIARFRIPARGGAGNYVAWFSWQGYYDCVDVNVQPGTNAIVNRYGTVSTNPNPQITKLDHCEYLYINTPMGGCQQVVNGDTTKCLERCKKMDRDICLGVQVTRMTNPAGTLRMTPNIPFTIFVKRDGVQPGNDPQPCGQLSVDGRVTMGCTAKHPTCLASNYGPDDTVCFGVRPMRNLNNQAEGLYRVATSPEDPAWYSTCYFVQEEAGFVNLPAVPYTPPSWNAAGDKCVDCAFQKKVANMGLLRVPDWTKAFVASSGGVCADCDIKNSAQSMADLPLVGKTISTAAAEAPTAADTYQWLSMEDQTQCNCTGWQAMVSWCQSASTFETVDESLCDAATRPADAFPCAEPVCTYNLPEMDATSEPVVLADDVAVGSAAEEEAVQQQADQETAEIIKEEEAEANKNNPPAPAESSSSSPSWMFVGGSMAGTIAVIVGVLLLIVGAVIGALVYCQRQRTVASRDIGAISVEMGAHSTFHNVQ